MINRLSDTKLKIKYTQLTRFDAKQSLMNQCRNELFNNRTRWALSEAKCGIDLVNTFFARHDFFEFADKRNGNWLFNSFVVGHKEIIGRDQQLKDFRVSDKDIPDIMD